MLTVESLAFSYNDKTTLWFPSFTLARGANALITGPSGSGKTTLLHLVAGLLVPRSGRILINDIPTSELTAGDMDHYRGRHIGLMFQRLHLLPHITVLQNLQLAFAMAQVNENLTRAQMLLEELAIDHKKHVLASELSYGEAQRVAIARALLNEPLLILADEPTSNLDDVNCTKVMTLLINQARRTQATFMVTSHDHRIRDFFPQHFALGGV